MAIKPRREIPKRGEGGITEGAYLFFTFGSFFEGEDFEAGKTEAELKSFWEKNKAAIMGKFMTKIKAKGPSWAGNRPEFFWKDIKEPRLKTGVREYYKPWPDREKYLMDVFETDFDFLKRLNLLEAWELETKNEKEKK